MNNCAFIGRLVRNVELRYTQNGKAVANFTLAVSRGKEGVDFIRFVAWGKAAENLEKYTKKGDQLGIEGNLRISSYETEGVKKERAEIWVNSFHFIGSRRKDETAGGSEDNEDIPF